VKATSPWCGQRRLRQHGFLLEERSGAALRAVPRFDLFIADTLDQRAQEGVSRAGAERLTQSCPRIYRPGDLSRRVGAGPGRRRTVAMLV
jgi:hypothetical protein